MIIMILLAMKSGLSEKKIHRRKNIKRIVLWLLDFQK